MDDLDTPSAEHPVSPDVDVQALGRRGPALEVDPRAIRRPEAKPDIDAETLTRPPAAVPPTSRRRQRLVALAAVMVVALAGGGFWWRHEVTPTQGWGSPRI